MSETTIIKQPENRTLIMERVFNAPRERVWNAWADADELAKWWGPRGWETSNKSFDFKPGGVWHYCMKCLDEAQGEFYGQESWGKAVYESVNPMDRFIYKDYFSDADGHVNTEMPVMTITMEFSDAGEGKTRVRSTGVFDSDEGYQTVINMGVEEGASQTWDRLGELLEARQ